MDTDLHVQNFFLADDICHLLAQLPQRLVCCIQPRVLRAKPRANRHQLRNVSGDDFGVTLSVAVCDCMLRKAQRASVREVIDAGHGGILCDWFREIFQHGLQFSERLNTAAEKPASDRKHPAIHQPYKPFGRKNADGGGQIVKALFDCVHAVTSRSGHVRCQSPSTSCSQDSPSNRLQSTSSDSSQLALMRARRTPPLCSIKAASRSDCAQFDTGKSSGTQTFTDIKGHWAEKYIERAAELGWIKGFEDGSFRPDTYITRAQAMTMINRVLNRIPEDASDLLPDMSVWPDCNPGDWFYLAVQEATNSHAFKHKAGNYETWTGMNKNPDWTRYEH